MTLYSGMSMELAYRFGWALLNSVWEGVAVAVVIGIVLAAVPRRAAEARYIVLVVGMLALLVAFATTLIVGCEQLPGQSADFGKSAWVARGNEVIPSLDHAGDSRENRAPSVGAVGFNRQPSIDAVRPNNWIESLYPTVAVIWFCGVALLAVWRVAGWFAVQRTRVLRTELAPAPILLVAHRLAERLRLTHSFEVLISHFVETPMVIGWLRPVILIPASALSGLAPAQLEAILAHELAHIRRHDYLVNLLQILVETVMFYHPAVWWISSRIRLEREQACDDIAIELCADRREYASALVALEELRTIGSLALAAKGTSGRQMLARIQRILGTMAITGQRDRQWGLSGIVAASIVASVCVTLIHGQTTRADSGTAATEPFIIRNDAPKLSPFTAVRWNGEMPEVQFRGSWYRPVSINDMPADRIMAYLRGSNDFAPERHFAEDIVEVMRDMGKQPGNTVKLELETLDHHQLVTIPDAPMTEENRRAVYQFDHPADARPALSRGQSATQPFSLQNDAARLSPFAAVRWASDLPQVEVNGTWYELISINDIPAGKILDYLKQSNDFAPQKHFAEDMVEVMRDMGSPPGNRVKLVLKTLDTHQQVTTADAPMTEENRRLVLQADSAPRTPSTHPFSLRNDAPKLSPFTSVLWNGNTAMVLYNGDWYDLVSIDDIPTARILDYLNQSNDFAPQKHFAEDIVEVTRDLGHQLGSTVKLELKLLNTNQVKIVPAAPLTEENRRAVVASYGADSLPEPEIYVGGVVLRSGVYPFSAGKTTLLNAIGTAGMPDTKADYTVLVIQTVTPSRLEKFTSFTSLNELRRSPDAAIELQDGDQIIVKPINR